ncbi:hypothetical protein [Ureibacillus sp. FSL K6-2830]|uniref:hypothetical protein n=1 Tax=Ureibacillus sp. FSL K6-2830 TaxID=2954610 RepID=UPI0030F6FCA2
MKIGDKYTISGLKAKMSDGTIKDLSVSDVTVTSSRTDRVNVTGGELEALASGTSYIDISYNGKTIRKLVTVESTATIGDFYLDTALPSTMKIGDKYTISGLKAKMSDGTIKDLSVSDVTVTSSRTDRVNVTGGELEALASGTSYIDISYNGKTIRKLVTVESTATIGDFYLDTAFPSTMKIGDKYTISGLKAKMSDGTIKDLSVSDVTVTSSRTDRVNVTGGELEALASGTSYIDISYNGKIIRKLVTVESTATIVDFYLDTALPSTMKIGDKYTISGLKAKMSDGTIKDLSVSDVTVTSSRTDRVNVTGGELEALASGTSYIDISYNGKTIRKLVTVESTATIGDFYLDTALPSTMKIGDKYTISGLKAKMSDGTIKDLSVSDVTVTSSRTDRVNVTGGELEALASGTSYIDISYNGKIIRKLVTVESTATIVDFYLDTAFPSTMKIGDKYTISGLKAKMSDGTIKDLSVSDVTVTSSRTDRVNVNGGDLEAISKGTSYIDIIYNNKRIRSLITVSQ